MNFLEPDSVLFFLRSKTTARLSKALSFKYFTQRTFYSDNFTMMNPGNGPNFPNEIQRCFMFSFKLKRVKYSIFRLWTEHHWENWLFLQRLFSQFNVSVELWLHEWLFWETRRVLPCLWRNLKERMALISFMKHSKIRFTSPELMAWLNEETLLRKTYCNRLFPK